MRIRAREAAAMSRIRVFGTVLTIAAAGVAAAVQSPPAFSVEETTIPRIEAALRARTLTCRDLVNAYLRRISMYDKNGPALNAIVRLNPLALTTADELDRRFADAGPIGPLHCVPVIVKDNYETVDMPTTAGSLALDGMTTGRDAFVVQRLRGAGAVIIAKSNMAEFAFTQYETVNSILPGYTRNPYDLNRVTAGSSGGTAAAIAANFGAVGLGTDTGASIRGPASHQALVGVRPTLGLTSRTGVVPVFLDSDVTGPMTRTVRDAAAVLQAMAAADPADSATLARRSDPPTSYAGALVADGLRGARIGVLHQSYDTPTTDQEVAALFQVALDDLRRAGAQVIDPVAVNGLDDLRRGQVGLAGCNTFKFEINRYLAGVGDKAPMHSLEEILKSRRFHPSIQLRLETSQAADDVPGRSPGCMSRADFRAKLRAALLALMDSQRLDALVYPTWSNPPRLIGDLNTPHGDNNQLFSPSTGFPAITIPMGYTRGDMLPAGLQLLGRAWSEATLIRLAYAYEQATHHRRPPASTPPPR
jgi:Asp-tRNA(Asn)/Glu-tRNA(Gln) amidotransferase A subunit family amidase